MDYDFVIVGGGLVGAGLAAALVKQNLRIALIEAKQPRHDDPRLFALNHSSCQFLKNIVVWDRLAAYASPIHEVHVSRQGHFGAVRLKREEVNLASLGHVIPAHRIEFALHDLLQHTMAASTGNETGGKLSLYCPAQLKTLEQNEQQVALTMQTPAGHESITASIVIGADGTDSTVRQLLAIPTQQINYEQSAIVTRTTLKRSHHQIAYERFDAHGAIAMLPLMGNECATIWTADQKTIPSLMDLSDEGFLQTLQQKFGHRLGRLEKINHRHVFPLRLVRAEKNIAHRVMLLGNSAHTLHPIAAQGFNLAVYEAAALVQHILETAPHGKMMTALHLQTINERIKKQQNMTMGLSHRLSQLFNGSSFVPDWALQLGLIGLDATVSLKKQFIERLLGRAGEMPRMLLSPKT